MLAFKIISLLSHSEGNKICLKSAVFLQSSSGSCLHPSTLYELESCLKSMKKGILFSFFFTIVESYLTSLKIFENLSRFEKKPQTVCEMYKTSNSLRLVYFQVKKPKHLMVTRKRAMCFHAGCIKYCFPLSAEQFSVKKLL